MPPYVFQRGETIAVVLEAVGATAQDIAGIEVTAVLKRAIAQRAPAANIEAVAEFDVSDIASGSEVDPGWLLRIDAATSATIAPGVYITNGVLTLPGGDVEKTEPLLIQIEEAT
ncbi:conserved hypothetical protein [Sphingomonas sp. AX6]|nr:conserved hypothetical protein [Sphingomonas sp. AX6]